jgi:hypothetical protein
MKVVVRGHIASVLVPQVFDITADDSMKETYHFDVYTLLL